MSSIGAHANPDRLPPMKAAPICSHGFSCLCSPPVKAFWAAPVNGNWSPVRMHMLVHDTANLWRGVR